MLILKECGEFYQSLSFVRHFKNPLQIVYISPQYCPLIELLHNLKNNTFETHKLIVSVADKILGLHVIIRYNPSIRNSPIKMPRITAQAVSSSEWIGGGQPLDSDDNNNVCPFISPFSCYLSLYRGRDGVDWPSFINSEYQGLLSGRVSSSFALGR